LFRKGYDESDNTWEPRENLSCEDLIEAFELQDRQRLEKEKKTSTPAGGDKRKSDAIPASTSKKSKKEDKEDEKDKGFNRGLEPDKIIGATDSSGELMFLLKW